MTEVPPTDRAYSPAAERNREAIRAELARLLPAAGDGAGQQRHLLEIASGTGQHAAYCGPALPGWSWWPSDSELERLRSVQDWCVDVPNVHPPLLIDVGEPPPWPGVAHKMDAIYCANLLHIAPWDCCPGLMRGAAAHLSTEGLLLIYGPFLVTGQTTAPSNLAFDADLRSRDPQWGLRQLEAVLQVAASFGLALRESVQMPANNLLLVLQRQ